MTRVSSSSLSWWPWCWCWRRSCSRSSFRWFFFFKKKEEKPCQFRRGRRRACVFDIVFLIVKETYVVLISVDGGVGCEGAAGNKTCCDSDTHGLNNKQDGNART